MADPQSQLNSFTCNFMSNVLMVIMCRAKMLLMGVPKDVSRLASPQTLQLHP